MDVHGRARGTKEWKKLLCTDIEPLRSLADIRNHGPQDMRHNVPDMNWIMPEVKYASATNSDKNKDKVAVVGNTATNNKRTSLHPLRNIIRANYANNIDFNWPVRSPVTHRSFVN